MTEAEFPALYRAADAASNSAQATFLRAQQLNFVFLVGGAVCALLEPTRELAIASAMCFLSSLGIYAYIQQRGFQAIWYRARALAESVKTATWRLVMGAQPFDQEDERVRLEAFRQLLSELLRQNQGIGKYLTGGWSGEDQVTPALLTTMRADFNVKKQIYLKNRIDDQRQWYTTKSVSNERASRHFFTLICLAYGIAIILLLFKIASPDLQYLPIEVLAVVATSLIAWKQLKRFDELASAYSLTAHELGIIKSRFSAVENRDALAAFVSDAENAFSREHTQWAARRDH
ncbi:MAG: DUF4231 domain-containing protein [Rhodoluna sp.]|jgi:hypothetical protein